MGKTYVCSDLHGMLPFFKIITEYIEPEDKVYFLGDAGDRGAFAWETIKAIAEHPQFVYLKGNHEDLLVKALKDYLAGKSEWCYSRRLLIVNGGDRTFEACISEGEERIKYWIEYLEKLPTFKTYERPDGKICLLSHAGFTPIIDEMADETKIIVPSEHELIWDRQHLSEQWEDDDELKDYYVIHGHTPIPSLVEDEGCDVILPDMPEEKDYYPYFYAGGHKICIDAGCFFQGKFILLDLDTFDSILFSSPDFSY